MLNRTHQLSAVLDEPMVTQNVFLKLILEVESEEVGQASACTIESKDKSGG